MTSCGSGMRSAYCDLVLFFVPETTPRSPGTGHMPIYSAMYEFVGL